MLMSVLIAIKNTIMPPIAQLLITLLHNSILCHAYNYYIKELKSLKTFKHFVLKKDNVCILFLANRSYALWLVLHQ